MCAGFETQYMKNFFLLFGLLLLFTSCEKKVTCHIDPKTLKSNDSIISKVKSEKSFVQLLNKVKEPELETLNRETYRFLILSSFGNYKTYRINKYSDNYIITTRNYVKYFEDTISHEEIAINRVGKKSETTISETQWLEIKALIDKIDFWELPVSKKERYLDGTAYIIEGYSLEKNACTQRNYHVTSRISVSDSTIYKSIFNKISKFAEHK